MSVTSQIGEGNPPTVAAGEAEVAEAPAQRRTRRVHSCHRTGALFLRLLALIYLSAFGSLLVQIRGLVGSRGILPIAPQLDALRAMTGAGKYLDVPTLLWLNASDTALTILCLAGIALAVLLFFRIAPALAAAGLWACYLSLVTAGQDFLSFQWDGLLLEAGFLAIFLSPLQLLPRRKYAPPSRVVIWLYRWLLFRLMFLAGAVKWLGGDVTWRHLEALRYHYWTQPLPTWSAWYANCLPTWFGRASVVATLVIELLVPLLFFLPRALRRWGFWLTAGFQCLILATGNYGFFNLLTIALCVLLLDDDRWPIRTRKKLVPSTPDQPPAESPPRKAATPPFTLQWPAWIIFPLAVFLVIVTLVPSLDRIHLGNWIPAPARRLTAAIAPFRSANAYGLFEQMTTRRPEIIIEGSNDGVQWEAYAFKWKPGDLYRRPAFCTPHMPRLDWQMWFAGLEMEAGQVPPWFPEFLKRLLENCPEVARLMDTCPFGNSAPHYLRARIFYYHFTTWQERSVSGAWWQREESELRIPPVMLNSDRELVKADPQIK